MWEGVGTCVADTSRLDSGVSSRRGCLVFLGPYAWANFTILALGVWAVAQRDSIDAISMVSWGAARGAGFRKIHGPRAVFPSLVPVFPLFLVSAFSIF